MAGQSGDDRWAKGQFIMAAIEDGFDGAQGGEPIGEGAGGGGLEAIGPDGLAEAHDAQDRAVPLFRVRAGIKNGLNEGGGLGTGLAGPGENSGRRPIGMFLMSEGHVGGGGGMSTTEVGSNVGGHALAFEEDFDGGGGELGVDGFPDEATGNAVVMAIDFDVVVDVDLGPFPFGEFIGAVGEGAGGGAVELLEKLPAGLLDFPERTIVEFFKELADSGIHVGEGMKGSVAQDGEDPAFGDQNAVFDLGLVAGAAWPGGEDGGGVMIGHVLVGGIERGLIETGFEDCAL